jgi:type II secretory pathway pseudopilin PulG
MRMSKSQNGFSMLELLVASSIGLGVVLMMTSLFKVGMDTTYKITQRAETQQNVRAAIEMMTKDISLAGAGLPSGGLQLADAGTSLYGCDIFGTCYLPANTYPKSGAGTNNFMYPIEPGFATGVQGGLVIPQAPAQTNSSLTTAYCDYNFPLTDFSFAYPAGGVTAALTVSANANPALPMNILAPGGLQTGDLLLFQVASPGTGKAGDINGNSMVQTAAVVADITGISGTAGGTACTPAGACSWVLTFATGDPLNLNFTTGANNLAAVAAAAGGANAKTTVCRLQVVSYFLQVPAAGGTVQLPRLMRQVNGLRAVPVADGIINLQFTYDVINSITDTVVANVQDPIGAGDSPSLIQKVNIWIMGQSLTTNGNRAQSMYLATSVATRDMSFCNSYSSSTTQCQ